MKRIGIPILFIIIAGMLSLSFTFNFFGIARFDEFSGWQATSEALVTGRMARSQEAGLFSEYGFLQKDGKNSSNTSAFRRNESAKIDYIYQAQLGLQGFIAGALDAVIPLSNADTINLLYFLNSLLMSLIILLFAFWAYREFNLLSAIFIVLSFFLSHWMTISARNLYWAIWTICLPFVVQLWLYGKTKRPSVWIFSILAVVTIFIRTACGFEYISSILISLLIPSFYYGLKERWPIKSFIAKFLAIGAGGLSGFLLSLFLNILQRTAYNGGIESALTGLSFNATKYSSDAVVQLDPILKTVHTYLSNGHPMVLGFTMAGVLLLFLVGIALTYASRKYSPLIASTHSKLQPLWLAALLSLLGPLSWIVLAGGHAQVHTHINYILWFFPCIPMCLALLGAAIGYLLTDLWKRYHFAQKMALVLGSMLILSYLVICNYSIWDWPSTVSDVNAAREQGALVYQDESREIYHYNEQLYILSYNRLEASSRYYVHFYPTDSALLEDNKEEYFSYNTYYAKNGLNLPLFFSYCAVSMPVSQDYAVSLIVVGQNDSYGTVWEAKIPATNMLRAGAYEIPPANVTNENWTNGIDANKAEIILIEKTPENSICQYLLGEKIMANSTQSFTITDIRYSGDWIHLYLDSPISATDGYPNKLIFTLE